MRTETVSKLMYVATDDTKFNTEEECLFHEWELQATTVFVTHSRGTNVEAYSSHKLAREGMGTGSDRLTISKILIDERGYLTKGDSQKHMQ